MNNAITEKAFSMIGNMVCGSEVKPVVGVLFLPESACDAVLKKGQLGMKTVKGLGFNSIGSMESVTPCMAAGGHPAPTLYYFFREPCPSHVFVETLTSDVTKNGGAVMKKGDPLEVIPAVSGSIWRRFINPQDKPSAFQQKPDPPAQPKKVFAR